MIVRAGWLIGIYLVGLVMIWIGADLHQAVGIGCGMVMGAAGFYAVTRDPYRIEDL